MAFQKALFDALEKVSYGHAKDTHWALIFEAFGGFIDFLKRGGGLLNQGWIVDDHAEASLALVEFFKDFPELGHGKLGLIVQGRIGC